MVRERPASDNISAACKLFLRELSEERLLTIAMAADASAVVLKFTRFFDAETYDASQLATEALECSNSLHHLFVDGACIDHGLTHHMLAVLKTPLVWVDEKGVPCSVGGTDAKVETARRACKARFEAFTKLALVTLLAEFPGFHQMIAFQAFQLGQKSGIRLSMGRWLESVDRLAKLCGVNAKELAEQLQDR
jgi:hypothetical protein